MGDVIVHRESAEKIAPDLARMCLTIGRETVVDQSEMRCLKLCRNPIFSFSYCIFYLMDFLSFRVRMVQK